MSPSALDDRQNPTPSSPWPTGTGDRKADMVDGSFRCACAASGPLFSCEVAAAEHAGERQSLIPAAPVLGWSEGCWLVGARTARAQLRNSGRAANEPPVETDPLQPRAAPQNNRPTLNSASIPRTAKMPAAMLWTSCIDTFLAILSPRKTAGTLASIMPMVVPATTAIRSL